MKRMAIILLSLLGLFVTYRILFSFVLFSSFKSFGWLNSKEFFPDYIVLNPTKSKELKKIIDDCIIRDKRKMESFDSIADMSPYSLENNDAAFCDFFLKDTLSFKIQSIKEKGDILKILLIKKYGNGEWDWKAIMLEYESETNYS